MVSEVDYPAAHSMDTEWFAVDKDGFVAILVSNEEGAVPKTAPQDSGAEQLNAISKATGKTPTKTEWGDVDPASLGIYQFMWNVGDGPLDESDDFDVEGGPILPYKKTSVPEQPVHISQLPADMQNSLNEYKFKNVSFKDSTWVQPALEVPCQFWTEEHYSDLDIVHADGKISKLPPEML